jgi:hypothetical protein
MSMASARTILLFRSDCLLPFRADHVMCPLFACKWQAPEQSRRTGAVLAHLGPGALAALHSQLDTPFSPREPAGSLRRTGKHDLPLVGQTRNSRCRFRLLDSCIRPQFWNPESCTLFLTKRTFFPPIHHPCSPPPIQAVTTVADSEALSHHPCRSPILLKHPLTNNETAVLSIIAPPRLWISDVVALT